MRVLLTGAGGFLGQHAIRQFLVAGHDVVAATSQPRAHFREEWRLSQASGGVDRVHVIPREDAADPKIYAGVDTLVNAGFPRAGSGAQLADGLAFQRRLFCAARDGAVSRILNLSSQSVYGLSRNQTAQEGDPEELDSPYAVAKYSTELLADSILREAELSHLRLASLIGAGFPYRLVNKMITRALAGDEISVIRSKQIFDFMDVRDAARAIVEVAEAPKGALPRLLNIGASHPSNLEQIARCVVETVADERDICVGVVPLDGEGNDHSSALDCMRLHEVTGFQPLYDLAETIRYILRVDHAA